MDQVCFTFAQIAAALGDQAQWLGSFEPEKELKYIFTDTRETAEDSLFIAFSGENFDAHDFLEKAVQSGAQLLCVEKDKLNKLPPSLSVPVVAVKSTLAAYQAIANYHRRRFPRCVCWLSPDPAERPAPKKHCGQFWKKHLEKNMFWQQKEILTIRSVCRGLCCV